MATTTNRANEQQATGLLHKDRSYAPNLRTLEAQHHGQYGLDDPTDKHGRLAHVTPRAQAPPKLGHIVAAAQGVALPGNIFRVPHIPRRLLVDDGREVAGDHPDHPDVGTRPGL